MTTPRKPKKTKGAGPGKENAPSKKTPNVFNCNPDHISKVCGEIASNGLALRSTTGATQLETLPKVLKHFGPRGINTYEGTAAGYARLATRVKELKEVWDIRTARENVIGPDGLYHPGIGRYVFFGRRSDIIDPQGSLDLGVPA